MKTFKAEIFIIGVNPYVLLPRNILQNIMKEAAKDKGPIPVRLSIGEKNFTQTLVKYAGEWRLYLNMPMRKAAEKDVGDKIAIGIEYDSTDRTIAMHPKLEAALKTNKAAIEKFQSLSPSRQKEILRYINQLKSTEAVERNVQRAVSFLLGREHFVGRERP